LYHKICIIKRVKHDFVIFSGNELPASAAGFWSTKVLFAGPASPWKFTLWILAPAPSVWMKPIRVYC